MMASSWSIESFCDSQIAADWSDYPSTSRAFLDSLQLPALHPFCGPHRPRPYNLPNIPPQGPLQTFDHLETIYDVAITLLARGGPSLLSMAELWLRLLASLLTPLGLANLAWMWIHASTTSKPTRTTNRRRILSLTCWLTMSSSLVLMTDTLYVMEFGPHFGISSFVWATLLTVALARQYRLNNLWFGSIVMLSLALYLTLDHGTFHFGHADEQVRIVEGLYYDASYPHAQRLADQFAHYIYSFESGATPWMPTGDSRTGLPFLLNKSPHKPNWTRVFVPLRDGEVVAFDIAFPETGHDFSKTLYMVLHGLNGGSDEEYVKEFAFRRTNEGNTVAVMVARGLMDLPVRGWDVFHGARWTDAHEAATALRKGLHQREQILAGVGYSMGAIILSNYVASSGKNCALDVAISISGGLDMRYTKHYYRAQRLWHPILTVELREKFVVGKWGERTRARLSKEEMKDMMRAYHICKIDETATVAYNGFRDLDHYYSDMSALGDIPLTDQRLPSTTYGRIHNISVPHLVIHALDDPLMTWRSVAANEGLLHPGNLTKTGSGNLFLLLTKRGGHVGWPLGWLPYVQKWKWMNDAAMQFAEAYASSQ